MYARLPYRTGRALCRFLRQPVPDLHSSLSEQVNRTKSADTVLRAIKRRRFCCKALAHLQIELPDKTKKS
jgi:hypothetical protein